jgi:hypothetical protein
MRELEGRSYPEIAEALGVSVGAVEALIVRARRTLRLQASTLRGLIVLQLPRSLRNLFETGEAAVGAGALAKVAAVLVAGAVAGGIGGAVIEARTPAAPRTPSVQSWQHALASPAGTLRTPIAAVGQVRSSAVVSRSTTPAQTGTVPAVTPPAPNATSGKAQSQPQSQSPGQPQAQPQPGQVVATVQQTVSDAVQTVAAALPEPAVLPVPTPLVDVPTVAVPTVPPPPALPPAPALPAPPPPPPLP